MGRLEAVLTLALVAASTFLVGAEQIEAFYATVPEIFGSS